MAAYEVILHMYTNKTLPHKKLYAKTPDQILLAYLHLFLYIYYTTQHAVCECVYVCTEHFHTLSHQYLYSADAYTCNFANTTAWHGSAPLCF